MTHRWPITEGGPVALQLAEISAALRFEARNPGMLDLDRLARDVDQMRDTARRMENSLDDIVEEARQRDFLRRFGLDIAA